MTVRVDARPHFAHFRKCLVLIRTGYSCSLFFRIVGSLAGLSMAGSGLIIITAILFTQLRKHPYSLVLWLSLCDFMFSLKYVVVALHPDSAGLSQNHTVCTVTALYTNFFALASISWSAVMSFNLILNTARPFGDTKGYRIIYHLFVWSISATSTLLVGLSDDIGVSADGTCWFAVQRTFHWQFYVPLGCYFLLAVASTIFSIFRTWNFSSGAARYAVKLAVRMTLYVGVFIATWLGPTVNEIYTSARDDGIAPGASPATPIEGGFNTTSKLTWWTAISVALVGFFNALIWLSNPVIYRQFKQRILQKYLGCCYHQAEKIKLLGKFESMWLEDQDSDIHRLNVVFRNNALACLLLGIRYSLIELSRSAAETTESARFNHTLMRAGRPPAPEKHKNGPTGPSSATSGNISIPGSRITSDNQGSGIYGSFADDASAVQLRNPASMPNHAGDDGLTMGWSMPKNPIVQAVPAHGSGRLSRRASVDRMTGIYETSDTDGGPVLLDSESGTGEIQEDNNGDFVPDDDPHILSNLDFEDVINVDLSPENLEVLDVPDLFTSPFSFDDVAPHVFHNIRLRFGFKSAEYFASLAPAQFMSAVLDNQEFSGGRSGSFMCYSPNRRILIKTIPDHEAKTMKRILPAYYAHIESNPRTLLIPILGLYSLRLSGAPKLHIIVMANLFSHELMIPSMVYDLKGSWVDRGGRAAPGTGGKDNDLRSPLSMSFKDSSELYDQLSADSYMLAQQNVMDYSLLVGICDTNSPKRGNSYVPPRNLKRSKRSNPTHSDASSPADTIGHHHYTHYSAAEVAAAGKISPSILGDESPVMFDPRIHDVSLNGDTPPHTDSPTLEANDDDIHADGSKDHPSLDTTRRSNGMNPGTKLPEDEIDIAWEHSSSRKFSPYGKDDPNKRVRTTTARVISGTDNQQLYIVGIIDILQSYSLTKRIERFIKVYLRCKSPEGLSATKPMVYQDRFRVGMAHNIGFPLTQTDLPV